MYTIWFVFSPKPERLSDSKLMLVAWAFRIQFVLIVALVVLGKLHGWLGPPTCTPHS